jgi:hypothetical protein
MNLLRWPNTTVLLASCSHNPAVAKMHTSWACGRTNVQLRPFGDSIKMLSSAHRGNNGELAMCAAALAAVFFNHHMLGTSCQSTMT